MRATRAEHDTGRLPFGVKRRAARLRDRGRRALGLLRGRHRRLRRDGRARAGRRRAAADLGLGADDGAGPHGPGPRGARRRRCSAPASRSRSTGAPTTRSTSGCGGRPASSTTPPAALRAGGPGALPGDGGAGAPAGRADATDAEPRPRRAGTPRTPGVDRAVDRSGPIRSPRPVRARARPSSVAGDAGELERDARARRAGRSAPRASRRAVVSTWLIADASTRTVRAGGVGPRRRAAASRRGSTTALAKKSSFEKRKRTRPGMVSYSGCRSMPRKRKSSSALASPAARPSTAIRGRYARRTSASSDATTATTIPGRTPSSATAAKPTIASCASPWSIRHSRRNPRHVDEPDHGGDDDRGERRLRQAVEQRRQEQHRGDEQHGDEQPREARPHARPGADGAAGEARVDREALQQAGAEIRGAERDELLVRVDLVAALRRERARGADRLRERDEREGERAAAEGADLAEPDRRGCAGVGRPAGTSAITATPCAARSKARLSATETAATTSAHGTRGATRRSTSSAASAPTADDRCLPADLVERADRRATASRARCPLSTVQPEELRQLPDDDHERRSR